MVLTIRGTLWFSADGSVGVRVSNIEPGFARRGELYIEHKRAIASLRRAGLDSRRLSNDFVHDNPKNAFQDVGFKPERFMVLGPAKAQGIGDLRRRLSQSAGSAHEVIYRSHSWTAGSNIDAFRAHLQEAKRLDLDLVLLVQGGGHWSRLRGYQRADLALAIHTSPVPVATAVGHDANISLADRAAMLSFTTPTAAAEAIANVLDLDRWRRKRDARNAFAQERRQEELAAKTASIDLQKAKMKVVEQRCTAAREAEEKARTKQSEAVAALHMALRLHTNDLLETAEARVRFLSHAESAVTILAIVALVAYNDEVLRLLQISPNAVHNWIYVLTTISTGLWLLVGQRRARKAAGLPSASPMKHPPGDVDSWRVAVKRVRTVRKLRQLRRHMPLWL
ncbi:exodeoxyribonuclease VII large subunit [Pseudarthrobacter sp. NPDC058196]|uniref:exodeoxyribonuclease VII large subunit n=1 Tax=Pseudarthrobacter sp. NPDC058196 TaxID=3346376 RepID=UPI0036D7A4AD